MAQIQGHTRKEKKWQMMETLIWIGAALAALIFWFAVRICQAAKQMDEAFDALDREIAQRNKR